MQLDVSSVEVLPRRGVRVLLSSLISYRTSICFFGQTISLSIGARTSEKVREFSSSRALLHPSIIYAARVLPDAHYSISLDFARLVLLISYSSANKAARDFILLGILLKSP